MSVVLQPVLIIIAGKGKLVIGCGLCPDCLKQSSHIVILRAECLECLKQYGQVEADEIFCVNYSMQKISKVIEYIARA